MANDDVAYNSDHFSFGLEPGEFDRWDAAVPALGELAPDFEFSDTSGAAVHLTAFRGRPVVIELPRRVVEGSVGEGPPQRSSSFFVAPTVNTERP